MKIIENYQNIEDAYFVDSGISGPILTIFSGIHGDEISGIKANEKFLNLLKKGDIKLLKGKLQLVTKCNDEAIKIGKREVKTNLNRLFRDDIDFDNDYEHSRAKELMSLLEKTHYLLDLHSTPGPSIPFLYSENSCFKYAKKLGISHIIAGWNELGGLISGDTENYVNSKGGVGFTFEAGNHDSSSGEKNSFQAILNFLSSLGIIGKNYFQKIGNLKNTFMQIKGFYTAKSDIFKYNIDITNFNKINSGTTIGYDNGKKVLAGEDMILVMPKTEDIIKKGKEVFFIGKRLN